MKEFPLKSETCKEKMSASTPKPLVNILLVEDDEIDQEAIVRGFRKKNISNPIIRASDGIEALNVLRQGVRYPFLILLDLNMPRMNGIEFLKALRADASLKHNIVFVLTTSNDQQDRWEAYEQHIAGYLLKNDVSGGLVKAVDMLEIYWKIIEFPPAQFSCVTGNVTVKTVSSP